MGKRVKSGFILSIIILMITSLVSWYSIRNLVKRSAMVDHTHVVLVKLENIISLLKDAETSQRGYQLTGNKEFLHPYTGSYKKVLRNYNELQVLFADNPVQLKRLAALKKLIENKFAFIRKTIYLQNNGMDKESLDLVSSKEGKKSMDRVRELIELMKQEEEGLLQSRVEAAYFSSLLTPVLIVVASLIAIAIAILSFYKILRDINKRIQVEKELASANTALEKSLGELAVREEQVREMNQELEKRVETRAQDLLESERRYRFMAESIPAIVWTANPDGDFDYYSKKWTDYTGLSLEESKGWGWKLVHADDLELTVDTWRKAVQSGNEYKIEFRIKGKDGIYRWMLTRAVALKNDLGQIIKWFGTAIDIEDEKAASEKLRLSEEKYRLLSESIPQLIWTTDADGHVDYVNQNWLTYTGQTMEESVNSGYINAFHPDDRSKAVEEWLRSLKSGNIYNTEYRLKNHHGIYRWFLAKSIPVKDDKGTITKWFGTTTDIHDQKMSQQILKQKNEELQRINNDLDNFIYTASHDLKAPISNIEGLLYTLNDSMKSDNIDKNDLSHIASMMKTSTERFKHTIEDLTEITKVQKNLGADIEKIDLEKIFAEVVESIHELVKISHVNIVTDFDAVHSMNFSKKNMRSIYFNLLSNAIKFRSPDRIPEVYIKTETVGNYIVLTVKDNGLGIPEGHIDKIFMMFKRAHDHVEGTGIGLYIVKRIMDNSGGKIEVASEKSKGTTFKVYFKS
jgi:PAS domain S-box-containing protein